jgi:hypothetical protein
MICQAFGGTQILAKTQIARFLRVFGKTKNPQNNSFSRDFAVNDDSSLGAERRGI